MTNRERQASLDKDKWRASQLAHYDASGYMVWCGHCEYQVVDMRNYCRIPHERRVQECACARAYNRMVRGAKK